MSSERLYTAVRRTRDAAQRMLDEPEVVDSDAVRGIAFELLRAWATHRVEIYADAAAYPLETEEERGDFIHEGADSSVTYTADALAFIVGSDEWLSVDEGFEATMEGATDLPTVLTRAAYAAMVAELEQRVPHVDEGVDS